jgi:hypothetical protein
VLVKSTMLGCWCLQCCHEMKFNLMTRSEQDRADTASEGYSDKSAYGAQAAIANWFVKLSSGLRIWPRSITLSLCELTRSHRWTAHATSLFTNA